MIKYRFIFLLIILVLITTFFVACKAKTENQDITPIEGEEEKEIEVVVIEEDWELVFYCVDKTSKMLVPVAVTYPQTEGIAKAVVEELVFGSNLSKDMDKYGLEMPLPQNTKVLGLSINNKIARVDLSLDFLEFRDKKHEELSVKSLVYTLTQFSTIDSVEIVIEGKKIQKLPFGTYVNTPIDKDVGINLTVNDSVDLKENSKVMIYYPQKIGDKMVYIPETKVVNKTEKILEVAVAEFLKGPNSEKLQNIIPNGVEILGIETKGNLATINLSREFTQYDAIYEEGIINSLLLTVTELDGIEHVQLLLDNEAVVLPQGTDLGIIFSRPVFVKFN